MLHLMRLRIIVVGLALTATHSYAQPPEQKPLAFEVASVKPSARPAPIGSVSPDRFVRKGSTLLGLLLYAYDIAPFQEEGGDAWTRTDRFDVDAKVDHLPTPEQIRAMVQTLLTERFRLRVHVETRDEPRYALMLARRDGRLGEKAHVAAPPNGRSCGVLIGGHWLVRGCTMAEFAHRLQRIAQRIIVDKTGLTERYDLDLEFQMDIPAGLLPPGQTATEGVSLFTALQEQLGLKLESERGPVDVLVIDHVEKPTAD